MSQAPAPPIVAAGVSESPAELPSPAWLAAQLAALIGPLRGRRLCIAFSGGLDSTTLLALLAALRTAHRLRLRALHVDHQLHARSAEWARAAARQARRLRVACVVLERPVRARTGESLEALARATRYTALAQALAPGELLLTAHHQEDQLETVLLALLRGSGVRGLAAMSAVSPWAGTLLVRPLLSVRRHELERYAGTHALSWSEDPSNLDERFDRNFLRHRVLPVLRERWPSLAVTVARSAAHLSEARALLDALARAQLAPARDGEALRVSVLARLSARERHNALRYWIGESGLTAPDHRRLREIAGPLLAARSDAVPLVRWQGGQVRRHGDRLFAQRRDAPRAAAATPMGWAWRCERWVSLPDGSALGLCPDPHGDVRLAALPERLQISFRRGGERLGGVRARIALKDLLQTEGWAPWERAQVPLIGDGERIIAVADAWVDPAYRATGESGRSGEPGPPERARFSWRRGRVRRSGAAPQ